MKLSSWFTLLMAAASCSQPTVADSPSCPSPDGLPERAFSLPDPAADLAWTPVRADLPPGTGYVGPVDAADAPAHLQVGFSDAAWFNQVVLPLYDEPEGEPVAWLACGWLIEVDAQQPADPALFYPGYAGLGFIVEAEQEDWLRLRYVDDSRAWVARAHLGGSNLAYVSWRDRYRAMAAEQPASNWGYLSFVSPEPQPLYSDPDAAQPVVTLAPDHSLLPIEIRDDWMQVQAFEPGNFCIDDWQGATQTGWIRWHDPAQGGNQLREPYKGC